MASKKPTSVTQYRMARNLVRRHPSVPQDLGVHLRATIKHEEEATDTTFDSCEGFVIESMGDKRRRVLKKLADATFVYMRARDAARSAFQEKQK